MWVQMLEGISGGRPGGGPWPPKGYLIEVSDDEGESLIRGQLALPAQNPFPASSAPKSEWVDQAVSQGTSQDDAEDMTKAELREEAAASPPPAPDVPEPGPSDIKSVWVAYAVSRGASQEEAESLTKAQLQSAYGGRLLS